MRLVIVDAALVAASPWLAGMFISSNYGCALLSAVVLCIHFLTLRAVVRATKNRTVNAILAATTEDAA